MKRKAQTRARLLEFDINQRPLDIAEALLAQDPRILGFGIYIWNVAETTEVIAALRQVRPEIVIVLGGPEVSYETDGQAIVALADYIITGEADPRVKFAEAQKTIAEAKKVNGCSGEGKPWEKSGTVIYASDHGAPVVTFIHPGAHVIPKGATEMMVAFFKQHKLETK